MTNSLLQLSSVSSLPRVSRVIHHKLFHILPDGGVINDVSIVEVTNVDLAKDELTPVCLPPVSVIQRRDALHTACFALHRILQQIKGSLMGRKLVQFFWSTNLTSMYEVPEVKLAEVLENDHADCAKRIKKNRGKGPDDAHVLDSTLCMLWPT